MIMRLKHHVKNDDFAISSDDSVASNDELINEQRAYPTLRDVLSWQNEIEVVL